MSGLNPGDHLDRTLIQRALVADLDRLTLGFLAAVSAVREAERHVRTAAGHTSGSVTIEMDGGLNVRVDDPAHPDWTGAHSLADGMRIATKTLLRDAWREARRLHHPEETS